MQMLPGMEVSGVTYCLTILTQTTQMLQTLRALHTTRSFKILWSFKRIQHSCNLNNFNWSSNNSPISPLTLAQWRMKPKMRRYKSSVSMWTRRIGCSIQNKRFRSRSHRQWLLQMLPRKRRLT
ncbi:hypothetical protein GUJ93_ZPchr0012g19000 [Zizania palustris]|uniref:Uncharacterized protein n=1 Tax=Zizania palustris TaxID=103762 RepID=A0A8J6BZK5_ZIZPA|nr:hypothetical protein GUJ93_ZPchr0012g19000 [Zizania palustris]